MQSPIAIVCSSAAWGGLEINVLRMARWLSETDRDVVLIGREATPLASHARKTGLDFLAIAPASRYFDFGAVRQMQSLAERRGVKALIVNTNKDLFRAVLTKLFSRNSLKLAYVQHMQLGVEKRDLYHTWLYRKLDAWITPLAAFSKREQPPAHARETLGLPHDGVLFGVIGRLDPQKNQALLIRAAAPLIRAGMKIKLVIVGENTLDAQRNYSHELRALCSELGVGDSVYFLPFMEDPKTAYAALDAFVLTSDCETYGMVTIEAMAAGLPVIATRSGGTPELVDDGQTGILFEPGNDQGLKTAIGVLLQNPDLRRRMGAAGRRKAFARFSHEAQISGMLRAIGA